MKKSIRAAVILFLLTAAFLFPVSMLGKELPDAAPAQSTPAVLPSDIENGIPEGYLVYDMSTGTIIELETEEFISATVALEMTHDSPAEALKAQAIAARSYYDRLKADNIKEEYYFTCNSAEGYIYADSEYFQAQWGELYEENMNCIISAVESTDGMILTYEGQTASTPYFPISWGSTLMSEDHPYLISVASPYDVLSPYFEEEKSFTPDEIKEICLKQWPEGRFDFSLPYENWFTDIQFSAGSSVYSTKICGFGVTGNELRDAFGLNSTAYDITFEDEYFVMHTKGIGHGAGMSQYGAISMASAGAGYEEILAWYYPGTIITQK